MGTARGPAGRKGAELVAQKGEFVKEEGGRQLVAGPWAVILSTNNFSFVFCLLEFLSLCLCSWL